jgi:serine/threonine protein kinase
MPETWLRAGGVARQTRAGTDDLPQLRQLGPYRLLELLGRGGMAEVFKAEHRFLGQIRALKILLPGISARPDVVGRLLTEARAMARLRHPAIVQVYDCDVCGDTPFIVMEYLPGEPLRTWFQRIGKLARHPQLVAAMVGSVASGLAFAHGQGVVHRDLKPENILVVPTAEDEDGFSLKILDFGVAKMLRETPVTTTRHGCLIGTPLYMAPEQWRAGAPIDSRADIYALGCLLFELVCGHPPFCETDDAGIMRAHLLDTPPDVRVLEPELPSAFQPLIARMLAKHPDERHPSMDDVLTELEAISGQERSRWNALLRTPDARRIVARGTLGAIEARRSAWHLLPRAFQSWFERMGARKTGLALLGWFERIRARKTGLALLACVSVLGAALLGAIAWPGGTKAPARVATAASTRSPPTTAAASLAAPREIRRPTPRRRDASSYRVRVTSVPRGAHAWVQGETAARGRTPLDIFVSSAEAKRVRLVARGFKPATLMISPGQTGSRAHARLAPAERPPRPVAHRQRQRTRPHPHATNSYQRAAD